MLRKKGFILVLFFMIYGFLMSENISLNENLSKKDIAAYWTSIKKKADKMYSGLDLDVEIATGLYKRDDALDNNNYNGEIKIKVPIYSKEDKRAKEEKKRQFLDKGAELLKNLEIDVNKMYIVKEREGMLKATIMEDGMKSIEAYQKAREDKIVLMAEIDELVRKLEVMLM